MKSYQPDGTFSGSVLTSHLCLLKERLQNVSVQWRITSYTCALRDPPA